MSLSTSCLFPTESTSSLWSESEDAAAGWSSSCPNYLEERGEPGRAGAHLPGPVVGWRAGSAMQYQDDQECPAQQHNGGFDLDEEHGGQDYDVAAALHAGREEDDQSETESSLEGTPPPATLDEIAASFVMNEPLEDKRRRARDKHESGVAWMRQGAYGEALVLYKEALALYTEVSSLSVFSFWVQYVLIM
jgi:hypothetical protein